jgi:hypothetical protein
MEVKANINVDAAHRVITTPSRTRTPEPEANTASFQRADALDQALRATPVARPEAVARARELIGDVKYPPADTIKGIAALLALKVDGTGADPAR